LKITGRLQNSFRVSKSMLTSNIRVLWLVFLFLASPVVHGQASIPLRLVQTIPFPGVQGRLDHIDVDSANQRLFVAALENGSVEVIDLRNGRVTRSIPGFKKPQGIAYVPSLKKLFVASGDDGMVRVYRADTLDLIDSIKLELGPNRVAYDGHSKHLYVGFGGKDAGKDYGQVAVIDARKDRVIGDIRVSAHPSELLLSKSGRTLFVFVSVNSTIQKIDTKKRTVVATFPVSSQRPGDGAFYESGQRLMIGTHTPPQMTVMDSQSGKEVATLPTVDGMDGVYYDDSRKRIYVSGGRGMDVGYVFIYQQRDADHYDLISKLPTKAGAGTSFWSPELDRYYVAAAAHDNEPASILVFAPEP
jgi:DNA-binding beta-propeller fold protein YncE